MATLYNNTIEWSGDVSLVGDCKEFLESFTFDDSQGNPIPLKDYYEDTVLDATSFYWTTKRGADIDGLYAHIAEQFPSISLKFTAQDWEQTELHGKRLSNGKPLALLSIQHPDCDFSAPEDCEEYDEELCDNLSDMLLFHLKDMVVDEERNLLDGWHAKFMKCDNPDKCEDCDGDICYMLVLTHSEHSFIDCYEWNNDDNEPSAGEILGNFAPITTAIDETNLDIDTIVSLYVETFELPDMM